MGSNRSMLCNVLRDIEFRRWISRLMMRDDEDHRCAKSGVESFQCVYVRLICV